jgi:hypothetical protein
MMRLMSADYFARSPLMIFPVIALAIFVVVFVAVTVRALRTRRDELDRLAALPLSDSDSEVSSHV